MAKDALLNDSRAYHFDPRRARILSTGKSQLVENGDDELPGLSIDYRRWPLKCLFHKTAIAIRRIIDR